MPDHQIGNTPTRDHKIGAMIWNRQLTMIRHIHLPVGKSTGDEPLPANAQHLSRDIEGAHRLHLRSQQQRQAPGPGTQVENIQTLDIYDFVNRSRNIALVILPGNEGMVFISMLGIDGFAIRHLIPFRIAVVEAIVADLKITPKIVLWNGIPK
jgi:hypothetical protein